MPCSSRDSPSLRISPEVASTAKTLLLRLPSARGVRTHTCPKSLATSMAQTRSKTCSYSASRISSGALLVLAINPPPQAVHADEVDARGPGQGERKNLTGVLVATVRDPSGSCPRGRLTDGI